MKYDFLDVLTDTRVHDRLGKFNDKLDSDLEYVTLDVDARNSLHLYIEDDDDVEDLQFDLYSGVFDKSRLSKLKYLREIQRLEAVIKMVIADDWLIERGIELDSDDLSDFMLEVYNSESDYYDGFENAFERVLKGVE